MLLLILMQTGQPIIILEKISRLLKENFKKVSVLATCTTDIRLGLQTCWPISHTGVVADPIP